MATKPADSLSIELVLTPLTKERSRPITRKYRNLTDNGRAYQIEIKEQQSKSIQKQLSIMSKTIESIMNDCKNVHKAQNDLKVLNTILLDFEKAYNALSELLTEQQHASVTFWYDKQIETIMAYKEKVVAWIIDAKQRNNK